MTTRWFDSKYSSHPNWLNIPELGEFDLDISYTYCMLGGGACRLPRLQHHKHIEYLPNSPHTVHLYTSALVSSFVLLCCLALSASHRYIRYTVFSAYPSTSDWNLWPIPRSHVPSVLLQTSMLILSHNIFISVIQKEETRPCQNQSPRKPRPQRTIQTSMSTVHEDAVK